MLPWWSLTIFAALPQGILCIKHITDSSPGYVEPIMTTDVASATHHMFFGTLLIASLTAGIVF
jgi:hypothetical protein